MSRIAKEPVLVPAGLEVKIDGQALTIKSKAGQMTLNVHELVRVNFEDNKLLVSVVDDSKEANMQSGTTRALVHNMVLGLDKGFEKKLTLVGVGYRAQAKGKVLSLNLGYSHPIEHELPEGVTCETPSQTEIVLKSYDKCLLGQVAADIRAYRAPEPYKGKGVRYSDEVVHLKEAKKK
ncbi:MAG: 50S ribosomal protein L6 [Proteobacteria bacterium]|uniref:Large ribosomal subunit protein uL6 n=1 Tax=Candidatus Avisuccinivibrio stercorigallinarum TaxID=2840704 RepID=A0A9D9DBS2_9GAMM|nr:50S ribosomal protein L6 [Candidatus Avisuccinivibrio stercorigallinarum]